MKSESCGNCKFWRQKSPDRPIGEFRPGEPIVGDCRRAHPGLVMVPIQSRLGHQTGLNAVSVFPPINRDEWCGEWEMLL